jgi:thiol:disulfide interchange protein DsbD
MIQSIKSSFSVYKLYYKYSLIVILFLIFTANIHAQEYVTLTAAPSKKEFFQSENIRINVKAIIQSGYHINANNLKDDDLIPTTIKVNPAELKTGKISWPPSKSYKFSFSETELDVYEGTITIGINLKAGKNVKPGNYEITGTVNYQACNERACFAPTDVDFAAVVVIKEDTTIKADSLKIQDTVKKIDTLKSEILSKDTVPQITQTTTVPSDTTVQTVSTQKNEIGKLIEEQGLFLALVLIFIGGLALNLTPCVYPLIPITISYFGAQVHNNKMQQLLMALVYVLGMSVTYSVLGVVAALTGGVFGSALQNPIVVVIIALIMFALALSMFGLYEIRIPQSIANFSGKNRQGYLGTALMGLTVGFIAAPCIGPFVLALLVFVGQLGSAWMGFLLFFILSLGLGFPYIFLALFSSSLSKLPRSGAWMEGVKIIFGLLLIGLGLYTLQSVIPKNIFEIIFPLYIIAAGAYLVLVDRKAINSPGYTRVKHLIALAAVIWGSTMLSFGEQNFASSGKLEWNELRSKDEIENVLKDSKGRPTMIDFTADWCAACKELDKYTYTDVNVIEASKKFNNIKVDLTKTNMEISDRFKILGLPVVAFFDSKGNELSDLRVTGFIDAKEFQKIMEKAIKQ